MSLNEMKIPKENSILAHRKYNKSRPKLFGTVDRRSAFFAATCARYLIFHNRKRAVHSIPLFFKGMPPKGDIRRAKTA